MKNSNINLFEFFLLNKMNFIIIITIIITYNNLIKLW